MNDMAGTLVKFLALAGALAVPAASQAVPPVSDDVGVKAHAFDISQVVLHDGRFEENQVSPRSGTRAPSHPGIPQNNKPEQRKGAGPLLTLAPRTGP